MHHATKRDMAVFTIAQNEPTFLPIWAGYYRKHFNPEDIFVLDHDSSCLTTVATASRCNRVPVHNFASYDHEWLKDVVQQFQKLLLMSYKYVLFTEVDEIVFPEPLKWPRGLGDYIKNCDQTIVRCRGYELVHETLGQAEPDLDLSNGKTILSQRRYLQPSRTYSKPLLAQNRLHWVKGFHLLADRETPPVSDDLFLVHLHRMDYKLAWAKCQETASRIWSAPDVAARAGYQNRFHCEMDFREWFYRDFHDGQPFDPHPVPSSWKEII